MNETVPVPVYSVPVYSHCPRLLPFIFFIVSTFAAAGQVADSFHGLSDSEILDKSREFYSSLVSYSDEGTYFQNFLGEIVSSHFKSKMSRPDLYRVSWKYDTSKIENAAWSAGDENFIIQDGGAARNEDKVFEDFPGNLSKDRIKALAREQILSGSDITTSIPAIFFNVLTQDSVLNTSSADLKRLADDRIGDVECYVLVSTWRHRLRTVWIGKSDFLVHQIKLINANDPKTATALKEDQIRLTKMLPNLTEPDMPNYIVTVETHTNIVVNQKFVPADFAR